MGFYQVEIFGFMVLLINDWNSVIGASFNVVNQCDYTVWPGIRRNPGSGSTSITGFELLPLHSRSFQVPAGWSGRVWGRTGCNFKDSKNTSCKTGDCGSGQLECNGSQGTTPATLAEFTIGSGSQDFYDISLVDGFNLPIIVEAIGGGSGSGSCASTGCTKDLNQKCPTELRAAGGSACKSACAAFGSPKYCCTGDYDSSTKCVPTNYSNYFKSSCPTSYSYAYDNDAKNLFSCTAANYTIKFCPIVITGYVVVTPSNSSAPLGPAVPVVVAPPSNSPAPSGLLLGPVPSNSPAPDIRGDRAFTKSRKKPMPVPLRILIIALIVVAVILLVVAFVFLRRSKKRLSSKDGEEVPLVESLNYSLRQVQNATNNFSEDCKIGQGGFGLVYKGTLPNKQEVAVKKLSKTSKQGLEEFKNEILLLAKLQHRNLVRLLGFCFENQEMILIYEFFRNKSLDNFLFDPEKRRVLDWRTRHMIIEGIARGLLYLHEDSRLRIIHRDLKASNVLLDDNMNPKIADFGTARLLQLDQSKENTKRIAGTYGYMAPEYAIYGRISVKSDVFSFGVLLLEIISGQTNNTFYQSNGVDDLRSYAWKNFMNGTPLALLDPSVGELYTRNEVMHCIHVGLLCVQEDPQARPTMASVVIMLSSSSVTMPIPLQPAFFAATHARTGNVMQPELPCSVSQRDASFTELFPR